MQYKLFIKSDSVTVLNTCFFNNHSHETIKTDKNNKDHL